MVDKNNQILIRNVSEKGHRNLSTFCAGTDMTQGEAIEKVFESALESLDIGYLVLNEKIGAKNK